MVQWLRIRLVIQGPGFQSLVRELRSHMPRSNKIHAQQLLKPEAHVPWSPRATTREPVHRNEDPT